MARSVQTWLQQRGGVWGVRWLWGLDGVATSSMCASRSTAFFGIQPVLTSLLLSKEDSWRQEHDLARSHVLQQSSDVLHCDIGLQGQSRTESYASDAMGWH